MCGRFTLSTSGRELATHFGLAETPDLPPRYNIAPTQDVAVVRAGEDGQNRLDRVRWGLIPSWAKDAGIGQRTINARAETVAEKPAYRAAFRRRRCLVPADGFYEWSGEKGRRQAHWFARSGGEVFAIAGLWERWRDPARDDEEVLSCTLLTTEANATMRPFHHRMPVILAPREYARWLDPEVDDAEEISGLLVPCPPDWLTPTPVGSAVNDARNDTPACVEPLA